MNKLNGTHLLRNLIHRGLLDERLTFLFGADAARIGSFLRQIRSSGRLEAVEEFSRFIPILWQHGYISHKAQRSRSRSSLLAVTGVNFELTYDCNLNCAHCLQKGIRGTHSRQLSTQEVKDAILRVYLSGLCTTGINFTGGEVLGNRNDLFEIMKYTQSLSIPFRLNTNSWWSLEKRLDICGQLFSPLELVRYLKSIGLKQFAFSYDSRLVNPDLKNKLIESIKLCETARIGFQLIFTGVEPIKINGIVDALRRATGYYLYYLEPVWNEMVDIGGCTGGNEAYAWQSNKAPCRDKGFYHPVYLHISPGGKVRTCMYAVGSVNVGDITERPFADLINEFPNSEIGCHFTNPTKKQSVFAELVEPYLSMYRPIVHECTRNAVLARTIEVYSHNPDPNLGEIHACIARELNLAQVE